MSTNTEQFVLRTTLTSPFGRKVRMAVEILGLADRVSVTHADVGDEHDTLRRQNPIGKIPCLVRGDGSAVYDSSVIVEFLQDVADTDRLMPTRGADRFALATRARLADAIIDAGALMIYEAKWHEPAQISQGWLDYQRGKIERSLAAFEAAPPAATGTDLVAINLSCALEFLDRRKPVDWRPTCPRLAAWFDDFVRREPAFARIHAVSA